MLESCVAPASRAIAVYKFIQARSVIKLLCILLTYLLIQRLTARRPPSGDLPYRIGHTARTGPSYETTTRYPRLTLKHAPSALALPSPHRHAPTHTHATSHDLSRRSRPSPHALPAPHMLPTTYPHTPHLGNHYFYEDASLPVITCCNCNCSYIT